MGIYGNYAHRLIESQYDSSLALLENAIQDTSFITSLSETTILTEGVKEVFSNFVKKVKEIVKKVINFLMSIHGKVTSLFKKFFDKKKELDKQEEEIKQEESKLEFEEKVFDKDVFEYDAMAGCFFDRSNFMMDESDYGFKAFISDPDKGNKGKLETLKKQVEKFENSYGEMINGNVFGHCSTKKEFLDYITSEKFFNKFKKSNCTSTYLRDHESEFAKQVDYLKDLQKQATNYRNSWQKIGQNIENEIDKLESEEIARNKTGWKPTEETKENLQIKKECLNEYMKFVTYSAEACIRVITKAIDYAPLAMSQYIQISNFIKSCYHKKENVE